MNFVIERFLKIIIRDYGIDISYKRNSDGSYTVLMNNLDPELEKRILNVTCTHVIGNRPIRDRDDCIIRLEPIIDSFDVASKILFNDGSRAVCINFDKEHYANKIIKIDCCIKRYFEDHSLIDAINGNI